MFFDYGDEVSSLSTDVDQLNISFKLEQDNICKIRHRLDYIEGCINDINDQINITNTNINNIVCDLNKAISAVEYLANEMDLIEEDMDDMDDEIDANSKAISSLTSYKDDVQAEEIPCITNIDKKGTTDIHNESNLIKAFFEKK